MSGAQAPLRRGVTRLSVYIAVLIVYKMSGFCEST